VTRVADVEVLGPAVILRGAGLVELLYLAMAGARSRKHLNGVDINRETRVLLQSLTDAAVNGGWMASPRHDDGALEVIPSQSEVLDEISKKEAAVLLGLSHRQTQRLAFDIGARRVGGALVLDRGAVMAYAAERRANEDSDA
jgi:hypothetical protein